MGKIMGVGSMSLHLWLP